MARRLGNHTADLGAKEALLFHPRDEEVLEETDLCVKFARAACKLAAKLLPEFSALRASKDVQYKPLGCAPPPPPGKVHRWFRFEGFWRCARCLQIRRPRDGSKPLPGRCSGLKACSVDSLNSNNHKCVMFPCSDGADFIVCMRCKCYTSHGSLRGLHTKCDPPPGKFGVWAWQQICKGLHPKKKGLTVKLEVDLLDEAGSCTHLAAEPPPALGAGATPSAAPFKDLRSVVDALRREDKESVFQAKVQRLCSAAGAKSSAGAASASADAHDSD